ncbi:MAG: S8 family serine peptidase [Candidatus Manganitrophus sp.]|nr:S8 family serine peptidase [Candidatus Manganitrophus sp.]
MGEFGWHSTKHGRVNDFGRIFIFSSGGPTRDGRIKPDVTAPGFVISAASADCPVSDVLTSSPRPGWTPSNPRGGTSMAAPMVTGAAALILQADPTNFPRPLLQSTAVRDVLTGTDLPNNIWGHGKVNLLSAFTALQSDQSPTVSLSTGPADGTTVPFTATASDPDPDDSIAEYLWDFDNDGATDAITTTPTVSRKYPSGGTYTAKVIAVDQSGKNAAATTSITVSSSSSSDDGRGCFIATRQHTEVISTLMSRRLETFGIKC